MLQLTVKRPGDNDWMPSAIYEVSNPTRNSVEEYMKKLNDRVFQGRKDWVSLTGKVRSHGPHPLVN